MSVTRTITINVAPAALATIIQPDYLNMVVMKTPDEGIQPGFEVAWFTVPTQNISVENTFTWEDQYGVYSSSLNEITPGGIIHETESYPTDLGKVWDVNGYNLTPSQEPGMPGAITIRNVGTVLSIVGMNQTVNGNMNPINIVQLYRNQTVVFCPRETIKVAFLPNVVTKQVIEELSTLVVTFDMTEYTTGTSTFQADGTWTSPTYG